MKRSAEHPGDSPASTNGWPTTPDGIGADLAAYDEIAARDTFRLVTDTIPHLIWTASPDGDIDYCNQCWEDYTGMPAGRAKRLSLADALHPDDRALFTGRWPAAIADGSDFEIEIRIRRASDSSHRWHLVRAVPQRNRQGRIVRWVGTGTDVDARRQGRDALERRIRELSDSNERLGAILHSATNVSIVATDTNGTITDFNAGAEKLLGYDAAEVVGKHTPALFHLESEVAARARELSVRAGRSVDGFEVFVHKARRHAREERECTYVRKDGIHLTVDLVVSTLTCADGSICGFMGIATDITSRKTAEAAARAAEEHFRLIVESVEDYALLMLDPAGRVMSWNVGAQRVKGYAADEVLGRHFSLFDTPEGRADHHPERELRIAAEKGRYKEEGWRVRKDGSRYWAAVVLSAIYDEAGGLKGFAKVVHDITERKLTEERLQLVVEAAPAAMIMVGSNGRIALVNGQTEKLFGHRRDELLGQTVDMLLPERFRGGHGSLVRKFFGDASARAMGAGRHLFGLHRNGNEVPIEIGLNPIDTSQGRFVLASVVDITERRDAEKKLRDQASIIDLASDAILVRDAGDRITYWNRGAETLYGWSKQEAIGRVSHELLNNRLPQPLEEIQTRMSTHGHWKGELLHTRRDGSVVTVASTWTWQRDERTGSVSVLEINYDLTERKGTEDRLLALSQRLGLATSALRVGIWDWDLRTNTIQWDERMRQIHGLDADQPVTYQGWASTVLAEDLPVAEAAAQRMMQSNSQEPFEFRFRLPDGRIRHVRAAFHTVIDAAGDVIRAVGVNLDVTERRQAEAVLQEQAMLLDKANDAILVCDADGRITYWNQGAQELYGWSKQEVIGRVSHELLKTRFPQPLEEIGTLVSAHGHWNGELVHTRRDGSLVTVASTWTWQRSQTGSVRVLKINHDLTERKQAEDRLLALSQRLRLATSAFRLGIWDRDLRANTAYWDEGMRRIYGVDGDQPVSYQAWASAVLPEDMPVAEAAIRRAVQSGSQDPFEFRIRLPDGRIRHIQAAIHTVVDAAGDVVRAVGVNLDVTERKQAEAVLQEQAILLDMANDCILVCDADGRITYWNQGAQKLYGWTAKEALGQVSSRLLKTRYPLPRREIVKGLESDGHWSGELTNSTKQGDAVVVATTWTVRRDARHRMISILCIDRDISERKRAEAELAEVRRLLELRLRELDRTNRELAAKNEEIEAFVYIVSHDLRGPLVNLQGFCRELEMSCRELREQASAMASVALAGNRMQSILEEDIPDSLRFIHAGTTKLSRLLNALLEVSRTGRQVYKLEEVDLHAVARSTLDTLRLTIDAAGARISLQPLPTVSGDSTALGQVFANLIGNAVKYLDPGRPGRIEIGGELRPAGVHCWVRDNGVGLPGTSKDRLFQVFQRFHPKLAEGDGIGLALVRRIVERHGGKVWAEGEEGVGTAFHFTLPDRERPPEIGSEAREI